MSKRESIVDVPGANIGDQSQACETRSCLFLYPCSGVDICTDIHTYQIQYTVVFVSLSKISVLYIISKSYGGPYKKNIITAHVLQQTTPYRLYYYCCTDAGVPGANIGDQSRACETRSCLFFVSLHRSRHLSILIYILNRVHTVLFRITFKVQ